MKKRFWRILVKIVGVAMIVIIALLAVGPFLVPVRSLEGLGSAQQVASSDSQFVTVPFDGTDGIDIHYLAGGSELWEYLRAWSVDTAALAAQLADIRQPALVITGDSDKVVPVADSQRLDSKLPDSELVILSSCGHVPQEECPDAFEKVVDAWLSQ